MAVKSNVLSVIARETSSATPQQLKDYALARANTVSEEDPDGMDWFAFCIDPRPETKYFGLTFGDNIAASLGMSGNHYPLVDVTQAGDSTNAASVDMSVVQQLINKVAVDAKLDTEALASRVVANEQGIAANASKATDNAGQITDNSEQLEQLQKLQALQTQLIETDSLEDETREALLTQMQALYSQVQGSSDAFNAQLNYLVQQNEAAKAAYQAQIAAINRQSDSAETDYQESIDALQAQVQSISEASQAKLAEVVQKATEAEAAYQSQLVAQQQAFADSLAAEVSKQVAQIKTQLIAEASLQVSQNVSEDMTPAEIQTIVSAQVGVLFTEQLPQFEAAFAQVLSNKQSELAVFAAEQIDEMTRLQAAYEASVVDLTSLIYTSESGINEQVAEVKQLIKDGRAMAAEIQEHHASMTDVLTEVKAQLVANTEADAGRLERLADAEQKLSEDFTTMSAATEQFTSDKVALEKRISELKAELAQTDEAIKASIVKNQNETSVMIDNFRLEMESNSPEGQINALSSRVTAVSDSVESLITRINGMGSSESLSAELEIIRTNATNLTAKVNELAIKLSEKTVVEEKPAVVEEAAEEPIADDPAGGDMGGMM